MNTPLPERPLNHLYFYLTEGCNLACRHCWLAPRYDRDGTHYPTLPVDQFEQVIREAKPLGLRTVKLTGGEPLLHPQISQLIDIVQREELGLTIETNGLLLTKELAEQIARSPRRFISVSLDGADAETHEWVRGVSGSFDASCQAVRVLADAGLRPQVIFSVMEHNARQAEAMVRLAEELGAASLKYNIVQPTARGEKLHEMHETLDVAALIALGRRVEMELAPASPVKLYYDYPMAFRPLSRMFHGVGNGACGIRGILGVLANSAYALCGIGMNVPELVFGRIGADPLEKVWNEHPVLLSLYEGLPDKLEGICSRCLMKSRCLGSCIAQNYFRSGSLWAAFWFCEEAEQAGLFPTSRIRE